MSTVEMDEQLRQAEMVIGGLSISEALYGGPKGPGLNSLVSKLSDNVTSLSTTVAELARNMQKVSDDVNGGEGVRVTIRELKDKLDKQEKKFEKLEAWVTRIFVGLAFVGFGTCIVLGRIGYNIWEGVPGK